MQRSVQQANGDGVLASPKKKQRVSSATAKVTVVLGAQWGDEGKGKVVDMLAMDADVVCRCQRRLNEKRAAQNEGANVLKGFHDSCKGPQYLAIPYGTALGPGYNDLLGLSACFRAGKRFLVVSVEGRNRSRRHHVTISSNKHQDVNSSGHVTKIELELEEAPDDMILVGSMPSELDATGEINATYPDGIPGPSTVIVRAEEALIVILVLLLWAAAIALFFNRWGKIRMLEPYQPKFQQQHRQSCTTLEPNQLQNRRTYSKCNVLSGDYPAGYELNCVPGQMRPRQNSVFIGSSASLLPGGRGTPRRTKSAFDLQFLILSENNSQDSSCEQDTLKNFKVASESMKLLQRERRTSICQVDRTETIKSPFRDRGMSICHFDNSSKSCQPDRGTSFYQFDKMDVLARPLQRDRGGSICHFDRTDVLARSLHKDRIGSTYHFDRMDVLARPNLSLGKPLLRERRVSMCNFLEKDGEFGRYPKRERHLSVSNIDRIEKDNASIEKADSDAGGQKIFAECTVKENKNTCYQYDQPSCSKISDVVLGYKATCV
ncbi:PREDICTED: uncharacterized protein LOC108578916 [Habropoda laboriosa]|uniref:uncharacterized protein LOC108578916 n=1 Tax=Habropoda laboriosa TaxID=597456 RepID=UPI00083CCFEA|nr:PREDICTED: uncharacterized protein LOC108578916 [Habropoda laboriosa]